MGELPLSEDSLRGTYQGRTWYMLLTCSVAIRMRNRCILSF